MALLATPFQFKGLTLKNRIVMPPMCQYSVEAHDGTPTDWHFVHYVSRAVGGTGLIIMEMTDVEPDGRISNGDLGLWSDEQIPAYAQVSTRMNESVFLHTRERETKIMRGGCSSILRNTDYCSTSLCFRLKN